jgi:hypothetical protein
MAAGRTAKPSIRKLFQKNAALLLHFAMSSTRMIERPDETIEIIATFELEAGRSGNMVARAGTRVPRKRSGFDS